MPKKANTLRKKLTREELKDLDLEICFLEGIIKRDPTYTEAMQVLGDDYTRRGKFEDGLRIDEQLCRLRPDDALVHYNLACSYSLICQFDRAIEALEASIDLGYRDFRWMSQDPDLKNLRQYAAYRKIRAKVRDLQVRSR